MYGKYLQNDQTIIFHHIPKSAGTALGGFAVCQYFYEATHNAVAENFFHTLKMELVYQEKYRTRAEANRSIYEYIEVYYNRIRKHSSLGYCSPEMFKLLTWHLITV